MSEIAPVVLRAASAAVFIVSGYGKLLKGIGGFSQSIAELGFPAPQVFAVAAVLAELVGGVFIAVGLFTRYTALIQAFVMVVAIYFHVHRGDGFSGGWNFAFVMLMTSLALVILGPGKPSVDKNLIKKDC
jgi:putative oxidoreductase